MYERKDGERKDGLWCDDGRVSMLICIMVL